MIPPLESPFIVENIKQFLYCPRIVFFERCLPGIRPRTFAMDAGHEDHIEARRNALRRLMPDREFDGAQRTFDIDIIDPAINLRGRLDEVIVTRQGETIPVEYKAARKITPAHRIQVTAYALLLERQSGKAVSQAYIYLIPTRKTHLLPITLEDRAVVEQILMSLQTMIAHEHMPEPTAIRARCSVCEFRRFCNDV